MPSKYVYQGVWTKWDGRPWKQIWTVTNLESIFIIGAFAALLAVAQVRAWVIVRYLFIRYTRPNRLPDDLEVLSQSTALKITWHVFRKICGRSGHHRNEQNWEYKLPAWIGFWATLNILGFAMAGVMLPWFLVDGALGSPEVRSRATETCNDSWLEGFPASFINSNLLLSSSIWDNCHEKANVDSYCDPNFKSLNFYETSLRSGCIFPQHICLKDQPVATFTRANITTHDLGLNSKSKMTVSHRVSCSPVSLDSFIRPNSRSDEADVDGSFVLSIQNPQLYHNSPQASLGLDLDMSTNNSFDSGLEMFESRSLFSVQVLPSLDSIAINETSKYIHPLLRSPDAQTFLLVVKAGRTLYSSLKPVTDPLFAASKLSNMINYPQTEFYISDREAAGIGCIEQTQVCLQLPLGPKCYPWTQNLWDFPENLLKELYQLRDMELITDYMAIFWRNLESDVGIQYYLRRRLGFPQFLNIDRHSFTPSGDVLVVREFDPERQWISEMETLLGKVVVWQKISTLAIVQNGLDYTNNTPFTSSEASLCNRILLINGDYTNISVVGLWVTVGILMLICLISYGDMFPNDIFQNICSLVKEKIWGLGIMGTGKWCLRHMTKMRGMPRQDVRLRTLSTQAPPSPDEDPDDPI
jgi:hypothetical protein